MIQRGDKVLDLRLDMSGEVVDVRGETDFQIKWDEGYDSPLSGGTYWMTRQVFDLELVAVVGENGRKPNVPASLIDPRDRDLFEEALVQLSFELS